MSIGHLLEEPDIFQNHRVLKNGSTLVLLLERDTGPVVCKIAHDNSGFLEREAARIQQLKARYPLLGVRMPEIIDQGVIASGLQQDKTFYLLEYIEGRTLAKTLQDEASTKEGSFEIIRTVTSLLVDCLDEHDCDPGLDGRSGQWLFDYTSEAYHRLLALEHIGYLASLDEIVINGQKRKSLSWCFDKIFSSSMFAKLNDGPSTISILGHWNFHAENIILPTGTDPSGFYVIDPDPKIDVSDPLFSLARLFYSFPHDTAEQNQYYIETDALIPSSPNSNKFNVHYTWPKNVIESYGALYTGIVEGNHFNPALLDPRLADLKMSVRLDLCFLLCLLRGTSINHSNEFWVVDENLTKFQNSSVLMFLNVVEFANLVVSRMQENE
ncbi:MAG: phosphotransferase [Rhodospirillales bacterium]|nr:phosphotransferase [Rhodospirillales bacterium]